MKESLAGRGRRAARGSHQRPVRKVRVIAAATVCARGARAAAVARAVGPEISQSVYKEAAANPT